MRVAPRSMAWSRNALNLIAALHSTSGLGVRPAEYSRRNSANTRSLYSAEKFTASRSTPITSAAAAASIRSWRVEQYSSSSSSSQFFMKRPTTSHPARLRSSAATAESTPPDMPTTTRSGIFAGEDLEREAAPREVVVDAALHERRAVLRAPLDELVARKPVQRHDFPVERPFLDAVHTAAEAKAQERHVPRRIVPAVNADERGRLEAVCRFLEHFAPAAGDQRLARIEVAGGLVQHQPVFDALLYEQKAAVALDDRCHGRRRLPDAHAAFLVFVRMKSAMRLTPASIACLEAAYEKRTCCPSPGTREPKWMSASSATPASFSRRFLNSSESCAPTMRQASVTFGQT